MDELAREYHDTHDPEIIEEIYELARRFKRDGALKTNQDFSDVHWGVGFRIL
jgi:hypothetical protein